MKMQTKCTLRLSGLLLLEMLPIPFTAMYSLYVIRKRPDWFPKTVKQLYKEKEQDISTNLPLLEGHDSLVTRRRCTISLSIMLLLDILIPFTTLFGLYIARKRPIWFKNVTNRLYANLQDESEIIGDYTESFDNTSMSVMTLEKKYIALQKSNIEFAFKMSAKVR